MLVPSAFGVIEGLLERFRPCFFRPQFRNFFNYILGLVACEGKRNVEAINQCLVRAKTSVIGYNLVLLQPIVR